MEDGGERTFEDGIYAKHTPGVSFYTNLEHIKKEVVKFNTY